MLFWGLSQSAVPYAILTPETFDKVVSGPYPVAVRFYTEHRKYSLSLDEQWEFVGQMYQGIDGLDIAFVIIKVLYNVLLLDFILKKVFTNMMVAFRMNQFHVGLLA